MTRFRITFVILLLLAVQAGAAGAPAQHAAGVQLSGLVAHPQLLTVANLKAMPAKTMTVVFQTGRGEQKGVYTGPRLWDVLQAAQIVQQGKNSNLKRTITISAGDDYTVVLSLGELDPDYGNLEALLATEHDGKPENGVRLVMPGDKHGGRAVNDVVKIEVK